MKSEKKNRSLTPLRRWLTGDVTRHDERALDASAQSDPFLADAIEGYRVMPAADHAADVTRLKARLRQRSQGNRGAGFYLLRIAAAGAVLVAAWLVMQQFLFSDKMAVADAVQMEHIPSENTASVYDSTQLEISEQEKPEIAAATDASVAQQKTVSKNGNAPAETPQPTASATAPASEEANKRSENVVADNADIAQTDSDKKAAQLKAEAEYRKQQMEAEARAAAGKVREESVAQAAKDNQSAAKKKSAAPAAKPAAPAGRTITGKVTDDGGEPLIGATVQATASGAGTTTDVNGNYSLTLPAGAETLVFSYTGYVQLQIGLGKSDKLNVQLANNDMELSEVVVTAYGQSDDEEEEPVVSPRPVDGFKQFKQYVADNLRHPEANKQPRPRQTVRVRFTIEDDGSLSDFLPKGNAPQAYKDEAVRLLRAGPRWKSTAGTTASYRFVFE